MGEGKVREKKRKEGKGEEVREWKGEELSEGK